MTDLLLHLFVDNRPRTETHWAVGRLSGTVGIVCNLLLAVLKLTAGLLAGSVAVIGDGINNLTDGASSIVTLLGFRIAQRPADREHPFGHGRYEYLAGLVVASLVLLAGAELGKSSLQKLLHPEAVPFSLLMLAVMVLSIGIKLWMWRFNRRLGRMIESRTLEAAALDSRSDVIATGAVLLSVLADSLLGIRLDGAAGLAAAAWILRSGILLVRDTVSPLIGTQANEAQVQALTELVLSHRRILGLHDLMIHDYGPGRCFATLHAETDAGEDPLATHDQLDHIEQEALRRLGIHLVIHCDPVPAGDWAEYEALAERCAARLLPQAAIHDLRVVSYHGQKKLTFDLAVPYALPESDDALSQALAQSLKDASCPLPAEIRIDRQA